MQIQLQHARVPSSSCSYRRGRLTNVRASGTPYSPPPQESANRSPGSRDRPVRQHTLALAQSRPDARQDREQSLPADISRPASNCGLTKITASLSESPIAATTGGNTSVAEMNETSIARNEIPSCKSPGLSRRALVRSISDNRRLNAGSERSAHSRCRSRAPAPLRAATCSR